MKLRSFLVFNRFWIGLLIIALGFWMGFELSWWGSIPFFLIGLVVIIVHFMIGPITLIQSYLESGDFEGAQKLLDRVKYPNLLYKPIRSSYYMLRANLSGANMNLEQAEADLRKSLDAGMPDKSYEGSALLQLGSINMQKGNMKEAFENIKKAVSMGLPDEDSKAFAYLSLCSITMQRRDFRASKMYFSKAKSFKPSNPQIIEQVKEMQKYISRIPG
jgi:tetratricopeptide (TPR) repeat protein